MGAVARRPLRWYQRSPLEVGVEVGLGRRRAARGSPRRAASSSSRAGRDRAEQPHRVVARRPPTARRPPRRRRPGSAGARTTAGCRPGRPARRAAGGRTGRTVNRRIARTGATVAADVLESFQRSGPTSPEDCPDRSGHLGAPACVLRRAIRKGEQHGRTHPRHGRHARGRPRGRYPRRPRSGEPLPGHARPSSARATTSSAPRSCSPSPTARRRAAGADDAATREQPDRYARLGHARRARAPGPSRSQALVRPDRTWQHDAGHQDPGRASTSS